MKFLKGGLILLNICALSLTVNGVAQTVTNEEVKKELSNLQMYIDDDATFTKQPKVGFKPVLVQYRSSASKINGVMMCKMGFDTTNKKLIISGVDGQYLSIEIECTFIDNPEEVKLTPYVLSTVKITASKFDKGDYYTKSEVDTELNKKADLSGATFTGDVVMGEDNELQGYENIVDSQGHKRFIGGDITTIAKTGVTYRYNKWSLSGTHLIMVLAFAIANGTVLNYGDIATIDLPQWIKDKMIPTFSSLSITVQKTPTINPADVSGSPQIMDTFLIKDDGTISIRVDDFTANSDKIVRVVFDLLIDND